MCSTSNSIGYWHSRLCFKMRYPLFICEKLIREIKAKPVNCNKYWSDTLCLSRHKVISLHKHETLQYIQYSISGLHFYLFLYIGILIIYYRNCSHAVDQWFLGCEWGFMLQNQTSPLSPWSRRLVLRLVLACLPKSWRTSAVRDVFPWISPLAAFTLSGPRAVHDRWGAAGSGGPQGAGQAGADAPEEGGTGDQPNH